VAIVPAAGRSRRMGRPKLLLPVGAETVFARLARTLRRPEIDELLVVVRADDAALKQAVDSAGATLVVPAVDPPDMRASVEAALAWFVQNRGWTGCDGWMLIPADHPWIEPALCDVLFACWHSVRPEILVPTYRGRRGHPTLFQPHWADKVAAIPHGEGLNWLVRTHPDAVHELPVEFASAVADLDTPDDYTRLLNSGADL